MQLNGVEILPGDTLLYGSVDPSVVTDFVGWAIEGHTGGIASHVEKYVGELDHPSASVASRNGLGVALYPLRTAGCVAILRPTLTGYNLAAGMDWFNSVNHEAYDWQGLFNFFKPGDTVTPHALFCSAFATEFDRRCGLDAVHPNFPSNKISPSDHFKLPAFAWLWTAAPP